LWRRSFSSKDLYTAGGVYSDVYGVGMTVNRAHSEKDSREIMGSKIRGSDRKASLVKVHTNLVLDVGARRE